MTTTTKTVWTVFYEEKPWTANQDKNLHHFRRAEKIAEWRHAFFYLARKAKIPPCQRVTITVEPYYRRWNGKFPDPASCAPAAKAAVDGLVDAKVIPDDGPAHVAWVKFLPAVMHADHDGLVLTIEALD